MHQWERRLRDLSQALRNCGNAYFSPDLFRQNVNHFLQTSRTVTFIIQKHKANIPDFDTWYTSHILSKWKNDEIMTWAKEARNFIEKEGDLEMHSALAVTMIFSHLPEEDVVMSVPHPYLMQGDINALVKFAKKELPPGVSDAAVIQIERNWITRSLPDLELISALTIIYSSLFKVCEDLAFHLGSKIDSSIPHPTDLDPVSNDFTRTRFINIGRPKKGKISSVRMQVDPNFKQTASMLTLKDELNRMKAPQSLADLVEQYAMKAEYNFNEHGNHVPMLFLLDDNWQVIDFITTAFGGQADKFLFWRNVAKRAKYLKAGAFVWVSEVWIRAIDKSGATPVRELPITGEKLQLVGGIVNGEVKTVDWDIKRPSTSAKPMLERMPDTEKNDKIFFVRPLIDAMQSVRSPRDG